MSHYHRGYKKMLTAASGQNIYREIDQAIPSGTVQYARKPDHMDQRQHKQISRSVLYGKRSAHLGSTRRFSIANSAYNPLCHESTKSITYSQETRDRGTKGLGGDRDSAHPCTHSTPYLGSNGS